ncbi:MAG: 1-(5-phosphoribosyl)-5-[(5-phosphoribosylamino)methylideneamino]imidazole-4-carboxamide isomerase [Chloroflexia bacterium]|nr:1-(5-phosphoribosyl)-5-[(5-phosphoribosylamino)methylideneamino]imidazole-4-carboxamide isomerase [Chloroflexia bacterium]
MILYPAIDILGGKCVRLVEGDFDRETTFDADPVDAALRWQAAGASWLHVVDLDGAKSGEPVNVESVRRVCAAVAIPVQLGGGLRTEAHLEAAFAINVERAVLGTTAVSDPGYVARSVARWGDRIVVGLDARDGQLATHGWRNQSDVSAVSTAREWERAGVRHFIFTDIRRDGTLAGPNLTALVELIAAVDADVIASGGVAEIDDLTALRNIGVAGVIIGRALYDGRIDLREAVAASAPLAPPR